MYCSKLRLLLDVKKPNPSLRCCNAVKLNLIRIHAKQLHNFNNIAALPIMVSMAFFYYLRYNEPQQGLEYIQVAKQRLFNIDIIRLGRSGL